MNINELKNLQLIDLKAVYRKYLKNHKYSKGTIYTSSNTAFFIWNYGDKYLFWKIIEDDNFEISARECLDNLLSNTSLSQYKYKTTSYLYHIRLFRKFAYDNDNDYILPIGTTSNIVDVKRKSFDEVIPTPNQQQVEYYLKRWETLDNYKLQESSLDKLFNVLCPNNTCIEDILIKCSTLNDFYSTNIFRTYPVAKHILSLNIDERLRSGDPTLVDDIKKISIGNKYKNFYSFATKYCSHHEPLEYPIYDYYVEKILLYFNSVDKFYKFRKEDLKYYSKFKNILINFRLFYNLQNFTLKELDRYLWQIGKLYFPKKYYNKKK